jgi:hypothetical protein
MHDLGFFTDFPPYARLYKTFGTVSHVIEGRGIMQGIMTRLRVMKYDVDRRKRVGHERIGKEVSWYPDTRALCLNSIPTGIRDALQESAKKLLFGGMLPRDVAENLGVSIPALLSLDSYFAKSLA